jgi:hypothetical protein
MVSWNTCGVVAGIPKALLEKSMVAIEVRDDGSSGVS